MATRNEQVSTGTTQKRKSASSSRLLNRRSGKSIQSAVDEYLLDHQSQNHSPQTLRWHRISLTHFIGYLERQGIVSLADLETVHIRAWLVFLESEIGARGKARSARTRRWYAQSIHAFGKWLYGERYLGIDVTERVKLPALEKPLIRIIEYEEFETLLAACAPPKEKSLTADRNASRNRAILWLLWDTGIRLNELCSLRLENFDRQQGTIIVYGKGSKERRIALGRNALRMLLYYLDSWRQSEDELEDGGVIDSGYVFLAENGQALTMHGIEMLFKRLRKRADLTDHRITPHIFRHTFAVRYLMLGGDIFSLQKMLGHEDISTVQSYMHLNDVNLQTQKRKFSPGDNVPFMAQSLFAWESSADKKEQGGAAASEHIHQEKKEREEAYEKAELSIRCDRCTMGTP